MAQKVKIINKDKSYKKKDYPGIFGDYDKDGIVNIDDVSPLDKTKRGKVEPVPVSATFETLLELKHALDSTMYDSIDKLKKASPKDADIYARTKTPYSIVKKLVEKRLLNPTKGLTDLVGTTIAVNNYKQLIKVRDQIRKGLLGKVLEEEDMYENPKQGYMAYHYIVEVNKIPVEVQLKTKRTKDINELTHEPYKKGTINADKVLEVMEIVNKADKGDKKAIEKYKKIIKDKEKLAKSFDKKYGEGFAHGGELESFIENFDSVKNYHQIALEGQKKGDIIELSDIEKPDEDGIIGEKFYFTFNEEGREIDGRVFYDPPTEDIVLSIDTGNTTYEDVISEKEFKDFIKTKKFAKGGELFTSEEIENLKGTLAIDSINTLLSKFKKGKKYGIEVQTQPLSNDEIKEITVNSHLVDVKKALKDIQSYLKNLGVKTHIQHKGRGVTRTPYLELNSNEFVDIDSNYAKGGEIGDMKNFDFKKKGWQDLYEYKGNLILDVDYEWEELPFQYWVDGVPQKKYLLRLEPYIYNDLFKTQLEKEDIDKAKDWVYADFKGNKDIKYSKRMYSPSLHKLRFPNAKEFYNKLVPLDYDREINTYRKYWTNKLWDERGYDIPYLETLTAKELRTLYDTEFYNEENYAKGGELSNKVDISSLEKLANNYRTLADGIETGGRNLQKLQDYIKRGLPIPGEVGKMVDTSYTIEKTNDREAGYNFGMGSPFVLKDGDGKNVTMTYTSSHIRDMAKKLPMINVIENPNYSGIYFVITGKEKSFETGGEIRSYLELDFSKKINELLDYYLPDVEHEEIMPTSGEIKKGEYYVDYDEDSAWVTVGFGDMYDKEIKKIDDNYAAYVDFLEKNTNHNVISEISVLANDTDKSITYVFIDSFSNYNYAKGGDISYMMGADSNVNSAILQVISILKHADIDGETMQHILEELGMDEQIWKQLNVKFGSPKPAKSDVAYISETYNDGYALLDSKERLIESGFNSISEAFEYGLSNGYAPRPIAGLKMAKGGEIEYKVADYNLRVGDKIFDPRDSYPELWGDKPKKNIKPKTIESLDRFYEYTGIWFEDGSYTRISKPFQNVILIAPKGFDAENREINPKFEKGGEIKKGTKIRLIEMVGDPRPIKPGTEGVIDHIDDIGTLHIVWDNGRRLGIVPDVDKFEIIS